MTNRAYAKKQWRCGDGLLSFSYPEPFLRAVRRGALAKSISELASDWLVLTPDIVFLPCFCGIRLWIWPEPLVAPRVRRALGTRMDFCVVFNLVPRAIVEWMALGTRLCSIMWWYSVLWFHVERLHMTSQPPCYCSIHPFDNYVTHTFQWRNATAGGPPSIGHFWPPFAPLKIG